MQNDNFFEKGYGFRLKHERTRLNLTQEEIAEKCGISRVQWGKYEREAVTPSKKVLKKLEDLGIDVDYLISANVTNKKTEPDNLKDFPFSGEYHQLEGTEKKLYQMAYASDWVDEAEQQNNINFHPAVKQMLISAVAMHGLSQAGIFNLIDGLALFAKKGDSIFLDVENS